MKARVRGGAGVIGSNLVWALVGQGSGCIRSAAGAKTQIAMCAAI
ncbi:hypothetical protein [Methanothrix soehngenii]|nr:hypothetical protein [Methanothrix soehngenii]